MRAAVIAALLVCSAFAPAVAQEAPAPAAGMLPGGLRYEVRADPAAPAAAVALWFRAPSGGFGPTPVPGLSRLAAATVAGSIPITGTSLGTLVDRFGGRIGVVGYPGSVAVTALVPAERVAQTVRAMTAQYFAPVVTAPGFGLALRDVNEVDVIRSFDPAEAVEDALGAALFSSGPLHDGTIGSADALGAVTVDRVRDFAERAFRPANAILILTGDVDTGALREVAARDGAAPNAEPAIPQTVLPPSDTPFRTAGNTEGTGLGWIGPPITDEAAATALDFAADMLFAPRVGTVSKALADRNVTVTGKFVTYRDPGIFLVTISGADAVAALPVVERLVASAATPMPATAFAAARATFEYRLLAQMQEPADLADTFGWYAVEGDPGYSPALPGGRYFDIARRMTSATVARTIARYLGTHPAIVNVVKTPATSSTKR